MKTGNDDSVDIGLRQVSEWILECEISTQLQGSRFFLFGVSVILWGIRSSQDLAGRKGKWERNGFYWVGQKVCLGSKKIKWKTQYMRFYELALRVGYTPSTSSGIITAHCITFSCCVARKRMDLGKHLANITASCPWVESNTQFGYGGRSLTEPRVPIDLGMRFQTEFEPLRFCWELGEKSRVPRRMKMWSPIQWTQKSSVFP